MTNHTMIYRLEHGAVITHSDAPGYCVIEVMPGMFIPASGDGTGPTQPLTVASPDTPEWGEAVVTFQAQSRAWAYIAEQAAR